MKTETRTPAGPNTDRRPDTVRRQADNQDNTLAELQVNVTAARYNITKSHARAVVENAFGLEVRNV